MRLKLLIVLIILFSEYAQGQYLMDMVDTTTETGKGMISIFRKYNHLRFSGYIQPQYQQAESKGIESFEGGDFADQVSNRFMLRRSRVRIDYVHFGEGVKPGVQIVFQFDANERGFSVRDIWGRIFENKYQLFSFTIGMFARPMGQEINLSSSDRESPERGRMSQTLMKSERDLGAMVSFDSRKSNSKLKYLRLDLGIFNGQGINATGDFDNVKDIIGNIGFKPIRIHKNITVAAGTSFLYGGLLQNTKYVYSTGIVNGIKDVVLDSSSDNLYQTSPRHYYGANVQLKLKRSNGLFTELRGEFITGTQTGTRGDSETPTSLMENSNGFEIRKFNGAYFYFLHQLFTKRHQFILKYDWYDPNTKVKGNEIGAENTQFTPATIKYNTLGIGYLNYLTDNVKLVLYYAIVTNEKTLLPGYTRDLEDNVLTIRIQFRF